MYEHVLLQGKTWENSSDFAWDYLQPIVLFVKEALESMSLDEDDYNKTELYEIITSFIEDYYFENDDMYELMPLGDDDMISFVDRYGETINKILQSEEFEEDVEEIQIEAPDDLDRITQDEINSGIDYSTYVYPAGNRVTYIRRWASVIKNDDGSLSVKLYSVILSEVYEDL